MNNILLKKNLENISKTGCNDNKDPELVSKILVVDSRNRDLIKYPEPNKYIYNFIEEYKRIHSIELLYTMVPKSQYLINSSNNIIYLNYNNNNYIIYVPEGNYNQNINNSIEFPPNNIDIKSFISKNLDYQINNVFAKYNELDNFFKCLYDNNKNKYYFYYSGYISDNDIINNQNIPKFSLNFDGNINKIYTYENGIKFLKEEKQLYKKNSIGAILGFNPIPNDIRNGNYYCNTEVIPINFHYNNKKITLTVDNKNLFEKIYETIISNNPEISRLVLSDDNNFNSKVDILNFTNNINRVSHISFTGKSINYYNIYNYYNNPSNNRDPWKLDSIDRNNNKIIISTNSYTGNMANENSSKIYIRFSYIVGDNNANLDGEDYVLLNIDELDKLDSNNTSIQNSYELITFSNNLQIFEHSQGYGTIKLFNPVLSKLDKFQISFKNFDGSDYNFNGREHCLVFVVTYNNRNIL